MESTKLESKFYEEIHALECKYYQLWLPQYEKRAQIVTGKYEPLDEECDWESDIDEEELANEVEKKINLKTDDQTE